MTKTELLALINKINNMVSDAQANAEDLVDEIKKIDRELENIPDDISEIEDDGKEEE